MRVTLAVNSETVVILLWFVQPSVRNCIHRWSACDDQSSVADGMARVLQVVAVAGWTQRLSLTRR